MANNYCSACGQEVMPSMMICPSCGGRNFSSSPPAAEIPSAKTYSQNPQATTQAYNTANINSLTATDISKQAYSLMRGHWLLCAGMVLIYSIVFVGIGSIPNWGPILVYLLSAPFAFSWSIIALNVVRGKELRISQIFSGFNIDIVFVAFGVYWVSALFTFLWFLLLVIPGIIATLSYAMAFFLTVDDPSLSPSEAITRSKALMLGHKLRLVRLGLLYIGLGLLSVFTLGLGFLFLLPFYYVSTAVFYESIRNEPSA